MKKTFSCGQVIQIVRKTSIVVEGNSEEECNQKMEDFIKKHTDFLNPHFINENFSTEDINVIELNWDWDSILGTENVYVLDDEGEFIVQ